jgi:hypothetical protein
MDIFPTTMGMVGHSFVNTTFGIDLFSKNRNFVYFSTDDKLAAINDSFVWILQPDGKNLFLNKDFKRIIKSPQAKIHIKVKSEIQTARNIYKKQKWSE